MRITIITVAVASQLAFGQNALSLKDAVGIALQQNATLKASEAAEDVAAARITEARSGALPKVNYTESWTRSDNPTFVFSSLLTQRQFTESNFAVGALNRPNFLNNFQSVVTADQPLYDAGKTKRAVQMAELGQKAAVEGTRRSEQDVIAQVVRAYYDAQLSAEQLRVTEDARRSAEADLERAEARRDAGMATDADVLSIRVHLAGIQEERIAREAQLNVAHAAVNEAMGLSLDTPHDFSTPLAMMPMPLDDLALLEQRSVEERPEVRQTRVARELAETQLADTRSNLLPQVTLHGAFEADRQRFVTRAGANWLVSVGLRWNLFNGFADKARIQAGEAARRQSEAQQQRAESGVKLQVRQAWAELRAAQERIATADAAMAEAREGLRITQDRYAAGLATVTDLLRTEVALLQTETRRAAAIHDQRIAAAMLEFAAGTLNADSEVLQ